MNYNSNHFYTLFATYVFCFQHYQLTYP